ncbi:hypothetical protein Q3G72_000848 [Acer saccharum]|nr:hypothetical protein Q3G72_000848 [Acer saccharum]
MLPVKRRVELRHRKIIGKGKIKVGNLEPSVLASLDVLLSPIKEVETEDPAADLNTRERHSVEGKTTNLPKQEEFMDVGVVFKRLERWVVVVVDSISLSFGRIGVEEAVEFWFKMRWVWRTSSGIVGR